MADVATRLKRLSFGDFLFDTPGHQLLKRGKRVKLQEQPFQILELLLDHPGAVVTRQQLRDRLWRADTFVDFDRVLNTAIKKLRQALDDDADHPSYIETVPRIGYRFLCPVNISEPEAAPSSGPTTGGRSPSGRRVVRVTVAAAAAVVIVLFLAGGYWVKNRATSLRRNRIRSIAVLPLANLSGNPGEEYFADGVTEALTTELAKIGSLRVISHTSAMRYKDTRVPLPIIARELKVDAVLEGSVVRFGDRSRISVQLIDCQSDTHMWAQTYDRRLADILWVQSDVAQTIAREVRIQLTPQQKPQLGYAKSVNPDAYEIFLRGRYHWNRRTEQDLMQAVLLFQQAIGLDPTYAPAHAALADSYALLGQYGGAPPSQVLPNAKEAASRALELDETLPDAHASLAIVSMLYDYDWTRAEREFQRAIELNPNYASARQWYSEYLVAVHRTDNAIQQMTRALEVDPNSLIVNTAAGRPFFYARQYDRAIEQFHRALEMDVNFFPAHALLGRALGQKGLHAEAIAEFRKANTISPGNSILLAELAFTLARSGQKVEAGRLLHQLSALSKQRYVPSYSIALIHVGLGQKDQAVAWLEKAYQERSTDIVHLATDPRFDELQSIRRFRELLGRIGLPS
ncbi:MAG: winged helix-turn-helix domain-containing protein [Nitrospirae bacterium]|nr:winged helix-turn-helix domain-containing protein [Nitrospirota bacterium]